MTSAAGFRDSTQIVLPAGVLGDLRERLEEEFVLTVVETGDSLRIIGSPVQIRQASDYLVRNGVTLP